MNNSHIEPVSITFADINDIILSYIAIDYAKRNIKKFFVDNEGLTFFNNLTPETINGGLDIILSTIDKMLETKTIIDNIT